MMTAKPYDLESLGGEDQTMSNDAEMERFQRSYRGSGQRPAGAAALVRKPTIHPERARMEQIESELRRLEPMVRPIIGKLDGANWDTSRVPEDEWETYQRFQQLQRELKRLKGMPLVDVDDMNVPAGTQQNWNRQPVGVPSEMADNGHECPTRISFAEYVAAREALLLPKKPSRAGMSRINPFPATKQKLKRLFPTKPVPANPGGPVKPIPSPVKSARDGFTGFF